MNDTKKENENSKKTAPQFQKLMEMPVTARLILGECRMDIEEILKLGQGSMLELNTLVMRSLSFILMIQRLQKQNL